MEGSTSVSTLCGGRTQVQEGHTGTQRGEGRRSGTEGRTEQWGTEGTQAQSRDAHKAHREGQAHTVEGTGTVNLGEPLQMGAHKMCRAQV